MFKSLVDVLNINLRERNFTNIKLPSELQEHHSEDSEYIIKNYLFQSSQFRKWRITILNGGDKLQVFNTVAYPSLEIESPILGIDILWFGISKKLLAVFDFQPLIQNKDYLKEYCSDLNLIKTKYSNFDNETMNKIYDSNKYFSPWVIICRGNKSHLESDLNNVFNDVLKQYFKVNDGIQLNKFLNKSQVKKHHIQYDQYSSEKDPADKLFKKFFGEIWTNNFTKNFLFPLSKE